MTDNTRLEKLRYIADNKPSSEAWGQLCGTLDHMDGDGLSVGLKYIAAHIDSWPDNLRYCRYDSERWLKTPPSWWSLVRALCLKGQKPQEVKAILARSPRLRFITQLDLYLERSGLGGTSVFEALVTSPHLTCLTHLNLSGGLLRVEPNKILSSRQSRLTHLNIENNGLKNKDVSAFVSSPYLAGLTHLNLGWNGIKDEGVKALAESAHLRDITYLNLENNVIGDEGLQAIAQSSYMGQLTHLNLKGRKHEIGNEGLQALASSAHLHHLTQLHLSGKKIGDEGCFILASSPHLNQLTHLTLRDEVATVLWTDRRG